MADFTFKIKGIERLQKRFASLPQDIQEEVVGEIQAFGNEVNAEQQGLISSQNIVDVGALRQNTKSVPLEDGIRLISNVYYAPYVEFGTGAKVRVPAELSEYAIQFKGKRKGDFRQFVANLRLWCKRHGIPENKAFIIALNILNNGSAARPYFFPPYLRKRPELRKRIEAVLKNVR